MALREEEAKRQVSPWKLVIYPSPLGSSRTNLHATHPLNSEDIGTV